MQVWFVKGKGSRTCGWTALRPPRTVEWSKARKGPGLRVGS